MHTAIHTTAKRTLWTPDHDDILKERFHTDCLHDIASHIGCTRSTISRHARRLGLWKETPSGRNFGRKPHRVVTATPVPSSLWNIPT